MKKIIILSILLLLFSFNTISIQAVQVNPGTIYSCDNENYTVYAPMNFSVVGVNATRVNFNTTYFNVTSTNWINITLYSLVPDPTTSSVGDLILRFHANTTAGITYFNISGFEDNRSYVVYYDDAVYNQLTANDTGVIHFEISAWSDHDIKIREGSQAIRVTYNIGMTDMRGVGNTISAILGILIIVGAIMLIVGMLYAKGYIFNR